MKKDLSSVIQALQFTNTTGGRAITVSSCADVRTAHLDPNVPEFRQCGTAPHPPPPSPPAPPIAAACEDQDGDGDFVLSGEGMVFYPDFTCAQMYERDIPGGLYAQYGFPNPCESTWQQIADAKGAYNVAMEIKQGYENRMFSESCPVTCDAVPSACSG